MDELSDAEMLRLKFAKWRSEREGGDTSPTDEILPDFPELRERPYQVSPNRWRIPIRSRGPRDRDP
jgi:hypothetical protein